MRGDVGTVDRHLAALSERAAEAIPFYQQLGLESVTVAEAGGLPGERVAALRAVLTAGGSSREERTCE